MEAIERVFNNFHLIILTVVCVVQQMGEQMEEDYFTCWFQHPFLQMKETFAHKCLSEILTTTMFEGSFQKVLAAFDQSFLNYKTSKFCSC